MPYNVEASAVAVAAAVAIGVCLEWNDEFCLADLMIHIFIEFGRHSALTDFSSACLCHEQQAMLGPRTRSAAQRAPAELVDNDDDEREPKRAKEDTRTLAPMPSSAEAPSSSCLYANAITVPFFLDY